MATRSSNTSDTNRSAQAKDVQSSCLHAPLLMSMSRSRRGQKTHGRTKHVLPHVSSSKSSASQPVLLVVSSGSLSASFFSSPPFFCPRATPFTLIYLEQAVGQTGRVHSYPYTKDGPILHCMRTVIVITTERGRGHMYLIEGNISMKLKSAKIYHIYLTQLRK